MFIIDRFLRTIKFSEDGDAYYSLPLLLGGGGGNSKVWTQSNITDDNFYYTYNADVISVL